MPMNLGLFVKELTLIGSKIAQDARKNASWSKTISGAIQLGSVNASANGFVIEIRVPAKKAPQAGAFELGSGLHRTRGTPGKYIIAPRNKSVLAIPEGNWPNFKPPVIPGIKMIGQSEETGKYLLRYVEHPGVAPRPFLLPAATANMPELKKRILGAFVQSIKSTRVEIIA